MMDCQPTDVPTCASSRITQHQVDRDLKQQGYRYTDFDLGDAEIAGYMAIVVKHGIHTTPLLVRLARIQGEELYTLYEDQTRPSVRQRFGHGGRVVSRVDPTALARRLA